ncbi:uncharacterized protein LOC143817747 [Ranitomeya variabilis]|uniref:uncharacterized protein LOC143817747 n=1 Tax=Ranitomeya variabilis TaxID=490064 RepID=UPI004055F9E7
MPFGSRVLSLHVHQQDAVAPLLPHYKALSRTGKSIKPHTTYQQFKADTLAPARKVVSSDIPTFYLNHVCKQQQDADAPLLFLSKVILSEKSTIRPYLVSKRLYLVNHYYFWTYVGPLCNCLSITGY